MRLEEHKQTLLPNQLTSLNQRMDLLESFLETRSSVTHSRFAQGQLTIVDLSDPFLDSAAACGFFEIVTRLFIRADVKTGKVLVLDEAHKVNSHVQIDVFVVLNYRLYSISPPVVTPSPDLLASS